MIFDKDKTLPEFDRLHELIDKEMNRLRGKGKPNYIKGFKLQEYYNEQENNWLERYLTKNFSNPLYTWQQAVASMGVLDKGKAIFGIDFFRY